MGVSAACQRRWSANRSILWLWRQAQFYAVPVDQGTAGLIEKTMAEQGLVATQVPQQLSPAQIEARYQRGMEIARECQALPRLDGRTLDEIIGYDDFGLPT